MSKNHRIQNSGFGVGSKRHLIGLGSEFHIPNFTFRIGFTLVELLVVIAILGILMSLVTAGALSARRKGAVTKAKTTIADLEMAITMYSSDMGEYPKTGNDNLVSALQDDPGNMDWLGPYKEFKESDLDSGEIVDPWGKPYVYVSINGSSPIHRTKSFDIYSYGPDGQDEDGDGDDIYNW